MTFPPESTICTVPSKSAEARSPFFGLKARSVIHDRAGESARALRQFLVFHSLTAAPPVANRPLSGLNARLVINEDDAWVLNTGAVAWLPQTITCPEEVATAN